MLHSPANAVAPSMWLRRLWERMVAMYGHAWVSVYGVTPHDDQGSGLSLAGDTWAKVLTGVNKQGIAAGLAACMAGGAEFPPSAPRFRAMCLGIPALAQVKLELKSDKKSNFSRSVLGALDPFRFRQAGADQSEKLLREAYELIKERVMRGEALPDAPVAVIAQQKPEVRPVTPDRREAHCRAIYDLLRGYPE